MTEARLADGRTTAPWPAGALLASGVLLPEPPAAAPRRVLRADTVLTVPTSEIDQAEENARRVHAAELAAQLAQARAQGHAEGVAETLAAGTQATLRAGQALETLTATVCAQQDREVEQTGAAVIELALAVAEWVVRRELSADGTALLRRLGEGLTALLPSPTTRISVSHQDHALVTEWADSRGRVGTEVVADSRLAAGDAVVVTDAGRAEITVGAALRTAAEALGLPEQQGTR